MKMYIYLIVATMVTLGCSQNESINNNNPEQPFDSILEISRLSSSNFDIPNQQQVLDFGTITLAETTKVLKIKNTSSSAKNLALQISGEGYSIKVNRCSPSISAGASCEVTLAFKNRNLYNGDRVGELSITDSPEDLVLSLTSKIENKPDPNAGDSELEISMSEPFYNLSATPGKLITRDITVKNLGPGNIPSVAINLDPEYLVRINRCGALKVNQTCVIQVAYKDYRKTVPTQSSTAQVSVVSPNAPSAAIVLSTNTPPGPVGPTFTDTTPIASLVVGQVPATETINANFGVVNNHLIFATKSDSNDFNLYSVRLGTETLKFPVTKLENVNTGSPFPQYNLITESSNKVVRNNNGLPLFLKRTESLGSNMYSASPTAIGTFATAIPQFSTVDVQRIGNKIYTLVNDNSTLALYELDLTTGTGQIVLRLSDMTDYTYSNFSSPFSNAAVLDNKLYFWMRASGYMVLVGYDPASPHTYIPHISESYGSTVSKVTSIKGKLYYLKSDGPTSSFFALMQYTPNIGEVAIGGSSAKFLGESSTDLKNAISSDNFILFKASNALSFYAASFPDTYYNSGTEIFKIDLQSQTGILINTNSAVTVGNVLSTRNFCVKSSGANYTYTSNFTNSCVSPSKWAECRQKNAVTSEWSGTNLNNLRTASNNSTSAFNSACNSANGVAVISTTSGAIFAFAKRAFVLNPTSSVYDLMYVNEQSSTVLVKSDLSDTLTKVDLNSFSIVENIALTVSMTEVFTYKFINGVYTFLTQNYEGSATHSFVSIRSDGTMSEGLRVPSTMYSVPTAGVSTSGRDLIIMRENPLDSSKRDIILYRP